MNINKPVNVYKSEILCFLLHNAYNWTFSFHLSVELSIEETGYERSELQIFYCKNTSLRRYGSMNGLVEPQYLESLTSTVK